MANVREQLRDITECPICMSSFIDPRVLSCIHTFCFECLKSTAEAVRRGPEDKMSCPLCRKDFIIPSEGIIGLQKNFFMEKLLELKKMLQSNNQTCAKHKQKPLELYCAECKKIVCVSCFFESHKSHECIEVDTVKEEFRQTIKRAAWKASNYADEMILMRKNAEMSKAAFLKKIKETETAIVKRHQELKEMIEKDTKSVLSELSAIKSKHVKEMNNQVKEIDRCFTVLRSFESYCTELTLKGSASDICSSVGEIIVKTDEFEKDHVAFIGRPHQSVEVAFQATDLNQKSKSNQIKKQKTNNNLVGIVEAKTETKTQYENVAFVALSTMDFVKINLQRPTEISVQGRIPNARFSPTVAAVYFNTMYVPGLGDSAAEIWKYNTIFGWMKCASLVQGRSRESAAFVGKVLYICGGFVNSDERVLDSVEAYDAINDKCATVGKLFHCVKDAENCVPFSGSLYIFGGLDRNGQGMSHVQVYNTKENQCSLLSRSMPRPCCWLRAIVWETSVILLRGDNCFIFNFGTETWKERKWLKTGDYAPFGLVLDKEKVVIIDEENVRYVPLRNILDDKRTEWKIYTKFPELAFVNACGTLRLLV